MNETRRTIINLKVKCNKNKMTEAGVEPVYPGAPRPLPAWLPNKPQGQLLSSLQSALINHIWLKKYVLNGRNPISGSVWMEP